MIVYPPFIDFTISIIVSVHAGGFGSYMLAMDQNTYELIGADYPGNRAVDVKNPSLSWMIGFMFVVSFLGLFSLVALRKVPIHILKACICYVYVIMLHFSFWFQMEQPGSSLSSINSTN